jgi:NitT/TauT family transport system substrate-binding protein
MYVADQEGLFKNNQVDVEFIPASSAAERDQIINAGQADGMINRLTTRSVCDIQPDVRYARTATPDHNNILLVWYE